MIALPRLVWRLRDDDPGRGPVIVLSGREETPDLTPARQRYAALLGRGWSLAEGRNTAAEVRHIVAWADDDVTVVTQADHVPRAFLTLVMALYRAGRERQLRVWMVGVPVRWGRWWQEWRKIRRYQQQGDVAPASVGLAYLDWRDSTPW